MHHALFMQLDMQLASWLKGLLLLLLASVIVSVFVVRLSLVVSVFLCNTVVCCRTGTGSENKQLCLAAEFNLLFSVDVYTSVCACVCA